MIWVGMFLAGIVSEALVTGQTRAIASRRAVTAAILAFVAWCLWGLVLQGIILDGLMVLPFAFGAALGTWAVTHG